MKNIVYFDLETQKSFDEVGGRTPEHFRQLRGRGCMTVLLMVGRVARAELVEAHSTVKLPFRT